MKNIPLIMAVIVLVLQLTGFTDGVNLMPTIIVLQLVLWSEIKNMEERGKKK